MWKGCRIIVGLSIIQISSVPRATVSFILLLFMDWPLMVIAPSPIIIIIMPRINVLVRIAFSGSGVARETSFSGRKSRAFGFHPA